MSEEGHVDKFGRVLIPKALRDQLNLLPGDTFIIKKQDHSLLLRFTSHKSPLQKKGKVLVYCGQIKGDVESAISTQRDQRHLKILKGE